LESDRGVGSTFSEGVSGVSLEGALVSLAGVVVPLAGDEALAESVTFRGEELFEVELAGAVAFGVASVAFAAEPVALADVEAFVELAAVSVELAAPVELALVSFLSPFIALSNSCLEVLLAVELSEDSSAGLVTLTEDPSVAFTAVALAETFEEPLVTLGLLKLIDLFDAAVAFSEGVTLVGVAVAFALVALADAVAFAVVLAFV